MASYLLEACYYYYFFAKERQPPEDLLTFSLPSTFLSACCLAEVLWGLMR